MGVTKETADLWQKWADVHKMCVGTGVDPKHCVKIDDAVCKFIPGFDCKPETYRFALAIVENKPVFVGDTLWSNDYQRHVIVGHKSGDRILYVKDLNSVGSDIHIDELSWRSQQKTITINGKEFVAPDEQDTSKVQSYIDINGKCLFWDKMKYRDAVEKELIKILEGE